MFISSPAITCRFPVSNSTLGGERTLSFILFLIVLNWNSSERYLPLQIKSLSLSDSFGLIFITSVEVIKLFSFSTNLVTLGKLLNGASTVKLTPGRELGTKQFMLRGLFSITVIVFSIVLMSAVEEVIFISSGGESTVILAFTRPNGLTWHSNTPLSSDSTFLMTRSTLPVAGFLSRL